MAMVNREMYGAGFSMSLDKLVACLSDLKYNQSVVDLIVYVAGARPPLHEVTQILKSLWAVGIKCCFVETPPNRENEESWAREVGANHIVLIDENGDFRVKVWQQDRYNEKSLKRIEFIEYMKKNLQPDSVATITESLNQNLTLSRNSSIASIANNKSIETQPAGSATLAIIFVMNEKLNTSKRKRFENQIEQKLGNVLQKFNKKETLEIFAVELDMVQIKSFISCIDPNPKHQTPNDFEAMIEK